MILPAVEGTKNILKAAITEKSVKRIVFTSSAIVFIGPGRDMSKPMHFAPEDPLPTVNAHDKISNRFEAYSTAKILALEAVEQFEAKNTLHFDIVTIFPGFVIGRHELAHEAKALLNSSNAFALNIALGQKSPFPLLGSTVLIQDVAKIHVSSLDKVISGSKRFIAAAHETTWNDANEIVKRNFQSAVDNGILSAGGDQKTIPVQFDTSKTEEVFNIRFAPYKDQIKSVVEQYLELSGRK
jgi:nucleoside-diphosphate-sugar epimerase